MEERQRRMGNTAEKGLETAEKKRQASTGERWERRVGRRADWIPADLTCMQRRGKGPMCRQCAGGCAVWPMCGVVSSIVRPMVEECTLQTHTHTHIVAAVCTWRGHCRVYTLQCHTSSGLIRTTNSINVEPRNVTTRAFLFTSPYVGACRQGYNKGKARAQQGHSKGSSTHTDSKIQ